MRGRDIFGNMCKLKCNTMDDRAYTLALAAFALMTIRRNEILKQQTKKVNKDKRQMFNVTAPKRRRMYN